MSLFNNKAKAAVTSLKTVREQAANTIIALQNGTVSPMIADSIYKQSLTIVESYRVELRGIELALQTNAGLDFNSASQRIDAREAMVK